MIPNAVVSVPTREALSDFVGFCGRHNLHWCTGDAFSRSTRWDDYGADTVYFIEDDKISYSDIEFAKGGYLTDHAFDNDRPTDSRLFFCSVYDLIQIVEGGDAPEEDPDISFLDSLL